MLITILAVAKNGRRSASYAFGNFTASSGWAPGWSFFIGLLHAAYATSATGMILSYVGSVLNVYLLIESVCAKKFDTHQHKFQRQWSAQSFST